MDFDGNNSKPKHLSKLDRSPKLNNQTQRENGGKSYKNVWKKAQFTVVFVEKLWLQLKERNKVPKDFSSELLDTIGLTASRRPSHTLVKDASGNMGTVRKRSPENSAVTIKGPLANRKISAKVRKDEKKKVEKEDDGATAGAKGNWKKVFAFSKFMSLAKSQSNEGPAQLVIAGRYVVGQKMANGAFGQVRVIVDNNTNEELAVKLENSNAKMPMLFLEYRFYKAIGHNVAGFPKIHYFGIVGKYNALVMELLGQSLEEVFNQCNRSFSLKTILQIAIQMMKRIEHVHRSGLVYRDIKPENCLVGKQTGDPSKTRQKRSIIHMVDFGLSKPYIDMETGRHIPYAENKSLTGTVRYMSLNVHQGKEQSRRDDLLALGHMFFYFLTGGNLPWQGVKSSNIKQRYQAIGQIKEDTKISALGYGHPREFETYTRYCRSLKFSQAPDYDYLKSIFRGCMARNHLKEDGVFDWSPKDTIPLETKEIKQKFDLGLPIKILDEGKQKKQKDFLVCQDRPTKGENLNQQKSFPKQRDQANGSYEDTNSHGRTNGNEGNINDVPIVKCDIDWIKEGEKVMDRNRRTDLEQNTNGENLSSQQNKQCNQNNVAGKIVASNVSQNNLTPTKNIDTDIHTETHFNEIFDPEFHLDNIDAHRSRSLPTILLHSEDDDIDNDSIIERSNQIGACKPIKEDSKVEVENKVKLGQNESSNDKVSPVLPKADKISPQLTRLKSFRRGLSKRSLLSSGRTSPFTAPNGNSTVAKNLSKQNSRRSSRSDLFNADTGSIELPNLSNAKRLAGNVNIRLTKMEMKNNGSDSTLPPLQEPDEIRHSKLTRKISTDPVQESLTLPKLVLKTQEETEIKDKGLNRMPTPKIRVTSSKDDLELPIFLHSNSTANKKVSDSSDATSKSTVKSSSCWTHHDGPGYSLIPSAETTTMSSENMDIFGDSSRWTAVASDRALLNAPLHKQSCSDHGVRARNHSGPVNSSTFHRINRNKRNTAEQDLMVVNITTCCPFWNFMKRKPTW